VSASLRINSSPGTTAPSSGILEGLINYPGVINDFIKSTDFSDVTNSRIQADEINFANSHYSPTETFGAYEGGTFRGKQYNDGSHTEFKSFPTYSFGFTTMTTFKFVGSAENRLWTNNDVNFYSLRNSPPILANRYLW